MNFVEDLTRIRDRIYCCCMATQAHNVFMPVHLDKIGGELLDIEADIEDMLLEYEIYKQEQNEQRVADERKRNTPCREESKIHCMECERDQRKY